MSKLETVRGLNDSGPQLQLVAAIRELPGQIAQQTATVLQPLASVGQQISSMEQVLVALPTAVASETAAALQSLETLRRDVGLVLEAYDRVNQAQRTTLDELTREMADRAGRSFEQKAQSLSKPLAALTGEAETLTGTIRTLAGTAKQIDSLPSRLTTASNALLEASGTLRDTALSVRPPLWRQLSVLAGVAVLAGMVGSLTAETGQRVSEKLVPPSAEQQELETWRAMWRRATKQERDQMNQIVKRPAQ